MSSLLLALRLARREMRGGLKGFRVFLGCLMLGVAAIAGVGSLSSAIDRALSEDARIILGGDIELSFTHRPATSAQMDFLRASGQVSTVVEMRSMARSRDKRTLIELKAVDGVYPLVGEVPVTGATDIQQALTRSDNAWGAAVEASTLTKLGIALGDRLTVGDATFVARALITTEPDRGVNGFTLGPRVMIAADAIESTGLIQPGTLVSYRYRVALPPGTDTARWVETLKARFPDAGWRIRGLTEATPGLQNQIDRIALLLILVGLTALLVGGVGVANAVHSYLDGKTQVIATMKCLGAQGLLVLQTYLLQILMLAGLGIVLGVAIGAAAPIAVAPLLEGLLPVSARVGFYPEPLLLAAAFGALTALAFSLWPIARARDVPPAALFRDLVAPARKWPRTPAIVVTFAAIAGLAALAIVTSADRLLAAYFVAGSLAAFVFFRLAAEGIMALARRAPRIHRPDLRLAVANLHRPGTPTPGIVMSLGLGLTVLVMVTLVQSNIVRQLREQIPDMAPSFFFVDLQSDQVPEFDALLRSLPGVGVVNRVPSLRGRITKIKRQDVDTAPIATEARWATGSDRGLTYAATPPAGARMVAGEWWPPDYKGPPLISFDARIAQGLGVTVGDKLTVNVLGTDVEAEIANLRTIDWTTLGINFVIIFAPGTIELAPHTFLATAQVAPGFEAQVERAVSDKFPNVSVIAVRDALATLEQILGHIVTAARATASITLLAGTLVLAGAVFATHRRRVYDAVVLKVLGARRRNVIAAFLIEFGLVGIATSAVAAVIGTICAYAFARYVRLEFVFLPEAVIGVAVLATAAIIGLGLAGTWRALAQKPAPLLRNA
jgi:putative ABC transport system permease protein